MGRGNFEGKRGIPLYSMGTLYSHLCKNSWTTLDAYWVVGSDDPSPQPKQHLDWFSYSQMGPRNHVLHLFLVKVNNLWD